MKPFDASGEFRPVTSGADAELRELALRGAGATLLSGGVGLAIQVVATVVLARLLTPKDFGLVTMVSTFSLLLVNFGLNGLTEAVVQRDEINHALASTLFWINLSAGVLLTIGFAAAGGLLARFYHDPLVLPITVGIALTIFFTSTSVMHLALLKRAMQFSKVSVNDIRARTVSVVVSILLAWAGYGYWALVAGAIALPLSASIGAWLLCRWRPGFTGLAPGTGSVLRFAFNTYGNFSVNYCSRNTDNLLVGWRFDAQSLGFYKKAYDLFALSATQLVSSLTVVVVSTLSKVKPDSSQFRRYLLGALTGMAFVGMWLAADLTLVGKDLIRLLMGPKWEPAGKIFTFFGPGIGVMILYYTHGWIHLSIGRADRWLRWGIIEFVVTCLLFLAGLPWGPVGIAVAWTVSFWLLTVPALWYAGRPIRLGITPLLSLIWRYLVASLATGLAASIILRRVPALVRLSGASGAGVRVIVVSSLVAFLYLAAVVVLHGGPRPLYQIFKVLGQMVPTRKQPFPQVVVPGIAGGLQWRADQGADDASTAEAPLVSILIPAYNAEEWIADAIRSALAQTWQRKEIIVVDDGSTDRTLDVARQFEPQGVRVFTQVNQGASAARNQAFQLSQGAYIQWLDADDLLAPDKIAKQMEMCERGVSRRTLLSAAWAHFMYRPHRARFIPTALWNDLSPVEWLLRKMGQNVYMQTATWLVSRELVEAAGPWDVRLLGDDDGEYFSRVLLACDGVRFVPGAKVYYRAFGYNSLSYIGRFPRKLEAHWLSMKLHIHYLRSLENSPRVSAACLEYLRDSLIYFYPERPDIVSQAEQLALEMGEELGAPRVSWKYAWMGRLFGWRHVKPAQEFVRNLRLPLEKHLDQLLYYIGDRNLDSVSSQPRVEVAGRDPRRAGTEGCDTTQPLQAERQ
ncbi:MAG TPA: oligosaccharide flippase family protein [Terriglobales bacterium]|nr:oligosaccharide flippase family protein [Terriglobales bacterium]